jgi:hypothetical protein
MALTAFLFGFSLMAALTLAAAFASGRMKNRVAAEQRALLEGSRSPDAAVLAPLASLPAPVRRYLEVVGADGKPLRSVRLAYSGTARTEPNAKPMPIDGEEVVTADPPGFVWRGRMHLAPGIWIDARDRLVDGRASMLVKAESAIVLADVRGPELDQGAAIRLLGELAWLPTAYRDTRWVKWAPIDEVTARATLVLGDREFSADVHFASDGLLSRVTANRYRDVNGTSVLTAWEGRAFDYRRVVGVLVPFQMEAIWHLEGGERFAPFHFVVERIEFEVEVEETAQRHAEAMLPAEPSSDPPSARWGARAAPSAQGLHGGSPCAPVHAARGAARRLHHARS